MKTNLNIEEAKGVLDSFGVSSDDLATFYPNITKPLVKVSDLGISARTYYYWSQNDLVKADEKGNWAKLNLIEVLWIKIIETLRDFGFPVKEIKTIKETLHTDLYGKIAEYSDEIIKMFENSIPDKNTLKIIKEFVGLIKSKPETVTEKYKAISSVLGAIISEILLRNSQVTLLVYMEEGKYMLAMDGFRFQKISQHIIDKVKKQPHLSISINNQIEEFIANKKTQKFTDEFGLINAEEKEILNAIRDGKVREINIKKDQEENLTITTTAKGELTDDKVQMIKRILCMNEYDDVRIVLRNKKHIYLERKTKKKITTR